MSFSVTGRRIGEVTDRAIIYNNIDRSVVFCGFMTYWTFHYRASFHSAFTAVKDIVLLEWTCFYHFVFHLLHIFNEIMYTFDIVGKTTAWPFAPIKNRVFFSFLKIFFGFKHALLS